MPLFSARSSACTLAMLSVVGMGHADETILQVHVGNKASVTYQSAPMIQPKGGDPFRGSNFIHPLTTPSGFVVTDLQPSDHLHHFGLWWPWKFMEADGRKVLYWELQKGEGVIQARGAEPTTGHRGFMAEAVYLDRTVEGPPVEVLQEQLTAKLSDPGQGPASGPGYLLDLRIAQRPSGKQPVTITRYRYSGFSLRATPAWNRDNSTLLTSAGKSRSDANGSAGRWVRVQGDAGNDQQAGVLLMSHPDNPRHPEPLRTWNETMHEGNVFVNFNPVQQASLVVAADQPLVRRYGVYVYDGTLTAGMAEQLWQEWTTPPDRR